MILTTINSKINQKIKINYFQRKPANVFFSLENVFDNIRKFLPKKIKSKKIILPFTNQGLWKLIANGFFSFRRQAEINHIAGDIHYLGLFLNPKKTIITVADCNFQKRPLPKWKKKLIAFFWYKWPLSRVAYITVLSPTIKKELLEISTSLKSKIKIIPCPADLEFKFTPKKFNQKKPKILHFGTKYNKNLERVIKAVRDINCQLIVIGRLLKNQKYLLKKYKINYKNYYNLTKKEIIKKYQQSDLVLFPSIYEGFGLPIIEGQSVGRPVIISNLEPMKWVAGKGAILVDPYQINSIKEGIKSIIDDPKKRKQLVEKGLKNIQRFNPKKISQQFYQLYSALIK